MNKKKKDASFSPWREKLSEVIFGTETSEGKAFDVFLLWAILISVLVVVLESVSGFRIQHGNILRTLEWIFTGLFTVEYILRLISVRNPKIYAKSFFGIIDLLAIFPAYLSLFVVGGHTVLVIRALRLLRVFRIFKLGRYMRAANILLEALKSSREKILVFLGTVFTLVLMMGTAMYLIEGERHGFSSIPKAMYWAIVTMTTVGYGDIAPQTVVGQILASIIMVLGYSIIAVPTGFVSLELADGAKKKLDVRGCPSCLKQGHKKDARFCCFCGSELKE